MDGRQGGACAIARSAESGHHAHSPRAGCRPVTPSHRARLTGTGPWMSGPGHDSGGERCHPSGSGRPILGRHRARVRATGRAGDALRPRTTHRPRGGDHVATGVGVERRAATDTGTNGARPWSSRAAWRRRRWPWRVRWPTQRTHGTASRRLRTAARAPAEPSGASVGHPGHHDRVHGRQFRVPQ
jgi:hypothetical protein